VENEVNQETITEWAKQNKKRAKSLGLRLITNQKTPEKMIELDSLGDFEDEATLWAIDNPFKAKRLILKLLKVVTSDG
jgi:hypothetical protein